MIHIIPWLPVSSIPQCEENRNEDAFLQSFEAIGCFESTFIDTHQASKMSCKVRSHNSQIITPSFLEEIITSSNEVFKDFASDMLVEMRKLDNPTRETAKSILLAKQNAGSSILTLELQPKKSDQ